MKTKEFLELLLQQWPWQIMRHSVVMLIDQLGCKNGPTLNLAKLRIGWRFSNKIASLKLNYFAQCSKRTNYNHILLESSFNIELTKVTSFSNC